MKEEYLLTDELEYTNEPYAIAKIAGMKMCESYNIQYGTNFISVMPTNLYGPNDNYDLETSHVLPALIRKMHLGKCLENNDWQSLRKDLNNNPLGEVDGRSDEAEILKTLKKQGIEATNQPINKSTTQPLHQSTTQPVNISLWGSGTPRREFLHSDDMADACVYLMENTNFADLVEHSIPKEKQTKKVKELLSQAKELQTTNQPINKSTTQPINQLTNQPLNHSTTQPLNQLTNQPIYSLVNDHNLPIRNTHINIGTGKDISIKELAEMIKEIVGFQGTIEWNTEMPDGTYQKLLDVSKLNKLGWQEKIVLKKGIEEVFKSYQSS
jgi:GDP-L-fucose synthase